MQKILIIIILVSIFNPSSSFAVNTQQQAAVEDKLNVIVITGSRIKKALIDESASMTVVTEEEIRKSGAEQVGELLRDIPGVEITDTSVAGAKRVRIRGENGSNVLILVDGQEISEQRSFHGAAPFLLDASIIKQIEVIKGPASVLYGSKAIGGVVNIITKKGGEEALQFDLNSSYNSSTNGFDSNVQIYGSSNEIDYRLSISRANHGDREVPNGTNDNIAYNNKDGILENSSFDSSSINGYFAYNFETVTVGARVESFKADTESHTDNGIIEDGLDAFQLDLPKRDRKKVSAFVEATNLSKSLVRMKLDSFHQIRDRDFIQDLELNISGFAGPGSNMLIDLDLSTVFKQKNTGFQGQFDFVFSPEHYLVTGFEFTRDKMNSNVVTSTRTLGTVPFPPFTLFDVIDLTDTTVESHQDNTSFYIQDEWSINDDLTLTAGVRTTEIDTELDKENSSVLELLKTSDSKTVGSVSFIYSGINNTAIRAGFSQGFRVPSLLELLEGTPHGGSGVLHANSKLKPETSNNYEIGYRFNGNKVVIDSAIFFTKAKKYIDTVRCSSTEANCPLTFASSDTQYVNVDGAETSGFELFSSYELKDDISLYSNITYLHRKFIFTEFATTNTGHPAFAGRIGLKFSSTVDDTPYWGDFYVRGATDSDVESPDSGSPSGRDTDHYKGWTTANLSVGADYGTNNPITLSLHVNNILNKTYTPAQESLIAAGRHFVLRVGMKF